ncbi:unnamed protein product [Rotaria magnacalcarata]|uniref:Uncharacterized protein n=1 Tax=Rotaria magnacalcarata TaxID=392030 RepID=A0A816LMI2_9BILA|nr:unnamed protein product [Rotaria magnacalcarata]
MCSLNFKFRFVLHIDDIELQDALELAKTNVAGLFFISPCSQLPIEYLPDGFQRFKPNNISNDDSISIMHHDRDLQWINDIDTVDIKSISESVFQTDETDDSNDYDSPLHPYTDMLTNSFCFRLIKSLRQSKLSQSECHILFDLIHSALPSPNNLPVNINKLLQKLELNQFFFEKQICLLCYKEIPDKTRACLSCPTSTEYNIAAIYDSDVKSILIVLNFYLPGRQNDNANFIEVLSYTSSREECRRIWQKKEEAQNSTNFDGNNDCEVDA